MPHNPLCRRSGFALQHGLHQRAIFLLTVLALDAGLAADMPVTLRRIEQMLAILFEPSRTRGRDQTAMEISMRNFPFGATLPLLAGFKARRTRQPMEREHDLLFPGGIAMTDGLADRKLVEPAARTGDIDEVLLTHRRDREATMIALRDQPLTRQAAQRLPHRAQTDRETFGQQSDMQLLPGFDADPDHVLT